VEVVVVHFVQLYFVNALQRTSIQCLQIHLNYLLLHSSSLLQCLDEIKSIEQPFEALSLASSDELQLLVIFSFWWTCFWWRHHFMSTLSSRALWLQEQFSLDALSFLFCWFICSLLFFQNLMMISNFCLWSCTLEQILSYPIDNF